ncbi:MAG: CHAT domain-containing protein [Oscillatoria sp. SIO1A7]|nr:CHAT domain-containing protein [Oscillatoria sp. SIO1A7]
MARKRYLLLHQGKPLLKTKWKYFLLGLFGFALALGLHLLQPATAHLERWGETGGEMGGEYPLVLPTLPHPSPLLAQGNTNNASYLYQQGRFAEAADSWERALANFPGDALDEALTRNYLSLAYQQLGEWKKAENQIDASLNILEATTDAAGGTKKYKILARALSTKGRVLLALGKTDNVLRIFRDSAKIYEQLGDEEGKIGSKINQAQAMQALGRYRLALKKLAEIPDDLEDQPNELKATVFRNLGNAYQAVGDLERSWCALQDSLQASQSSQATSSTLLSLGNTARALGERIASQKNKKDALATLPEKECKNPPENIGSEGFSSKAEEFYNRAAENAPAGIGLQARLNYLDLLVARAKGKFIEVAKVQNFQGSQQAVQDLAYAQEQFQSYGQTIDSLIGESPSRRAVYARLNFAENLEELGMPGAKAELDKAVEQANELEDKRSLSYARGYLGNFYERQEQWSEATKWTEDALKEADAPDILYQWQWQLGRILKAEGNKEGAIEQYILAVNNIVRSIRPSLDTIGIGLKGVNPNTQSYFRNKLEPAYRGLIDLLLTSGTTETEKQKNRQTALGVMELLQKGDLEIFLRCKLTSGSLSNIEEATKTVGEKLKEVREKDKQAAIIYPIILQDRLAMVFRLPGDTNLTYLSTDVSKEELESTVERLRTEIKTEDHASPYLKRLSKQVYDWFVGRIEKDLERRGTETAVFVMDGVLRNLPVVALYDGREYLLQKQYSVAITQGLQFIKPESSLGLQRSTALAAGLVESPPDRSITKLPKVAEELELIKKNIPGTEELRDQTFTSTAVENRLTVSSFPIVHLATHGQFSSNPEETFIEAWDQPINVNRLQDLLQRRLPDRLDDIELLVLSACETAEGDQQAVLGLAGVAERSGARSTLASLWRINDAASADLIGKFYEELSDNPNVPKAKALKVAQENLLDDGASPSDWTPYVLVGNWL